MIKPFKAEISEETLQNIYSNVKNYQWHEMPDDGGWDYGTNLDYMKEFADYWVNKFNWRKTEEKINKFNNFKSSIDGIDIHFIHEKGSGTKTKPLLLSHGWPGSVVEFLQIIDQLAHPEKFGGKEGAEGHHPVGDDVTDLHHFLFVLFALVGFFEQLQVAIDALELQLQRDNATFSLFEADQVVCVEDGFDRRLRRITTIAKTDT